MTTSDELKKAVQGALTQSWGRHVQDPRALVLFADAAALLGDDQLLENICSAGAVTANSHAAINGNLQPDAVLALAQLWKIGDSRKPRGQFAVVL